MYQNLIYNNIFKWYNKVSKSIFYLLQIISPLWSWPKLFSYHVTLGTLRCTLWSVRLKLTLKLRRRPGAKLQDLRAPVLLWTLVKYSYIHLSCTGLLKNWSIQHFDTYLSCFEKWDLLIVSVESFQPFHFHFLIKNIKSRKKSILWVMGSPVTGEGTTAVKLEGSRLQSVETGDNRRKRNFQNIPKYEVLQYWIIYNVLINYLAQNFLNNI